MKIAAVVINYRTASMTADLVQPLLRELQRAGASRLFIVDNASQDGSVQYFERRALEENWGDRVSIIAAPLNGGYGYGINTAVRAAAALEDPPEYVYVINSDALPDEGSIDTLVRFLDAHPSVGVAGSRVHLPDGQNQGGAFRFPSVPGEIEEQAELSVFRHLLSRWVVAPDVPSVDTDVDWIPGTSMMIRRSTFESVGLFDEKFFLYFEEIDFCRRVKAASLRVFFVAGAPITHYGSVSTGLEDVAKRYPRYWYESRHRYFLKHHGLAYTIACDGAWLTGTLLRRLKHRVKPGRPERPFALVDFLSASLVHLTAPDALLEGGGPPVADTRAAEDVPFLELLLEDANTYEWKLSRPGLWAVAAHRVVSAAERAESPLQRRALSLLHRLAATAVDLTWGIRIPERVKLGRRVRLWNSRCMLLNARSIGNDVNIAEDTTFGPLLGAEGSPDELPILEDGVTVGSGAAVLGAIKLGSEVVVQPNTVVLKDASAGVTLLGVPAEVVRQ